VKKFIIALVLLLAPAFAEYNISAALSAGYGAGAFGALEASWDCQLFQPGKGALRPTLDLGYGVAGFSAAFTMRHLFEVAPALQVGGGVGLRYQMGVQAYLRGDVEYSLLQASGLPLFVGADVGYAYGFGAAPKTVVAQLKLGYNF